MQNFIKVTIRKAWFLFTCKPAVTLIENVIIGFISGDDIKEWRVTKVMFMAALTVDLNLVSCSRSLATFSKYLRAQLFHSWQENSLNWVKLLPSTLVWSDILVLGKGEGYTPNYEIQEQEWPQDNGIFFSLFNVDALEKLIYCIYMWFAYFGRISIQYETAWIYSYFICW